MINEKRKVKKFFKKVEMMLAKGTILKNESKSHVNMSTLVA